MLVRVEAEDMKIDGKAQEAGAVINLPDGAVADAVERGLVSVLPKSELKELAAVAVEEGVAGDPRDLQAAAAAGLDVETNGSPKRTKKR